MEPILRISSSLSEAWTAWTMLFLPIMFAISSWMQPGLTINSFRNLSDSKQRGNQLSNTNFNIPGIICLLIYQIGIFSMAVYTCLPHASRFACSEWLITSAIFALILLVQYLIAHLLAFIFFNRSLLDTCFRYRLEINTCLSTLFYPILLFALFYPQTNLHAIASILISLTIITEVLLLWKLFRLFFQKPLAGFYILLYLCTLEIIPLAGWIFVVNFLVNQV